MSTIQWSTAVLLGFGLLLHAGTLRAQEAFPGVRVAPWDGHKAAMSLTFDDGDPSQLDVAVPELDRRHMHGTFFLIANHITRKDDWRKILRAGHEIGNHTLDHLHPAGLTSWRARAQVVGAKHVLQKEFGIRIRSFAYPYTEITPQLRKWVAKNHLLARGGGGEGTVYDLKPGSDPDWMDIPSRATLTDTPLSTYLEWIREDYRDGAWMVWMIHGLEGTVSGWQPISKKNFEGILDAIQDRDIWAGSFLEVGSYFRAQKVFENCRVKTSGSEETWTWRVPDHIPPDVRLRVWVGWKGKRQGKRFKLLQDGGALSPDNRGLYPVDFSKGALTLRLMPNS